MQTILRASLICLMLPACAALAATPAQDEARARAFLAQLQTGKFIEAAAGFDAEMAKALPAAKLGEVWGQATAMFGELKGQGPARVGEEGGHRIVYVRLEHEKGPLEAKVVLDKADKIAGLFFAPPGSDAPPPALPKMVEERDLTVGAGEWKLSGALTLPSSRAGKVAAVVLVHGSGPLDRDESVGALKPFRDIAWGLAERGIAVLRYDKRTFAYREQKEKLNAGLTIETEAVDDAVAAVALLKGMKEIDPARIYIAGHSLGGVLAPRIAARAPEVAGLILLAPGGKLMHKAMGAQLEYVANLDGEITGTEKLRIDAVMEQADAIDKLLAGEPADPGKLYLGAPAGYWLSFKGLDGPAEAAKLGKPLIVLHGGRDYQVRGDVLALWTAALAGQPNATFKEYPALNHYFVTGTGPGRPAEYAQPGRVDVQVIEDLAAWIKGAGDAGAPSN